MLRACQRIFWRMINIMRSSLRCCKYFYCCCFDLLLVAQITWHRPYVRMALSFVFWLSFFSISPKYISKHFLSDPFYLNNKFICHPAFLVDVFFHLMPIYSLYFPICYSFSPHKCGISSLLFRRPSYIPCASPFSYITFRTAYSASLAVNCFTANPFSTFYNI